MCLIYPKTEFPTGKKFYKSLDVIDGHLISPFQFKKYKIGVNKSNRRGTALTFREKSDRKVSKGIHVYIGKPNLWNNRIIVEVKGFKKDFVAQNHDNHEAVFTQVTITKKEFERALKQSCEIADDCF